MLSVIFVFDGKVERIPAIGYLLKVQKGHAILTYRLDSYGELIPVPEIADQFETGEAVSLELNFNFLEVLFPQGTPVEEVEEFLNQLT